MTIRGINGPTAISRSANTTTELLEALAPFLDLKAQAGAHGVISKNLDGLAPLTVTVTKAQMLNALLAYAKACGGTQ